MKRDPRNPYAANRRAKYENHDTPRHSQAAGSKIQNVNSEADPDSVLIKTRSASSENRTGRRSDNVAAKSRSGRKRQISDSSKRQTIVLGSNYSTSEVRAYDADDQPYSAYNPKENQQSVNGRGNSLGPVESDRTDEIRSADDLNLRNENVSIYELLNSAEEADNSRRYSGNSEYIRNSTRELKRNNPRDDFYDYTEETDYEQDEISGPSRSARNRRFENNTAYSAAAAAGYERYRRRRDDENDEYGDYRNDNRSRRGSRDIYGDRYYSDYDTNIRRSSGKKSGFKKFLIVYSCFLLVAVAVGFIVFRSWAAAYENSQPYKIAADVADKFSDESSLSLFLKDNSKKTDCVEDISDVIDNYISYLAGKTISYSENSDYMPDAPSYDIKADGTVIAKITLSSSESGAFGLSSFELSSIKIDEYIPNKEMYQIYAPEDSTIYINDDILSDDHITAEAAIPEILTEAAKFVDDIPRFVTYTIYLSKAPTVTAQDSSGSDLSVNISDGGLIVIGCEASDEFIDSVDDIVDAALTSWGTYFINMSDDLSYYILTGCDWYSYIFGSEDMDPILTWLYDYEYIADYEFTERSIGNYVKYSDSCFTVDVSYKMDITFTVETYADEGQQLDATWVFIPSGDGWVIVDCFYKEDTVSEEAADEDTES